MKYIGAHVDCKPNLSYAPLEAEAIGARAFALNLVDPSRWRSPEWDDETVILFKANCQMHGFTPNHILPHAGFVINLCSPEAHKLKLSIKAMEDEMRRARRLGLTMLNFHPGAHLKKMSDSEAIELISSSINQILDHTEGVTAVIENTAGQGSNLGYTFSQISQMIESVEDKSRVGVCVDTAHAFAAGYDLATDEGYDAAWKDFEQSIGFGYLRGMHINDSLKPLGSRVDRHAPIGQGLIGRHFFERLMKDTRFDDIPLILETPQPELWQQEVAELYEMERR